MPLESKRALAMNCSVMNYYRWFNAWVDENIQQTCRTIIQLNGYSYAYREGPSSINWFWVKLVSIGNLLLQAL